MWLVRPPSTSSPKNGSSQGQSGPDSTLHSPAMQKILKWVSNASLIKTSHSSGERGRELAADLSLQLSGTFYQADIADPFEVLPHATTEWWWAGQTATPEPETRHM